MLTTWRPGWSVFSDTFEKLNAVNIMKKQLLLTFALLGVLVGLSTATAVAQETITADKTGRFHLGKAARVGDKVLDAGMYQVQHFDEKADHIVIFRKVEMGYRGNMGNQNLGEEVLRAKCTVEAVDKKIGDTIILLRKNAGGDREAFEVWIRGERVKHVLPAS